MDRKVQEGAKLISIEFRPNPTAQSRSLGKPTVLYGKKYRIVDQIFGSGISLDRFLGDFWRIWGVMFGGFSGAF